MQLSCICPIHWSHVLSREWRCSWSSAHADPTTSEWSTILLLTKMWLILEVWGYIWFNITSGKVLMLGDITWSNVDLSLIMSSEIHLRSIFKRYPSYQSLKLAAYLKFHSNFPGPMNYKYGERGLRAADHVVGDGLLVVIILCVF